MIQKRVYHLLACLCIPLRALSFELAGGYFCLIGVALILEGGRGNVWHRRTRKMLEPHPDGGHRSTLFAEQTGELSG